MTPPLSIAPMMDRTDRHFRYLMRLITKDTLLYTEMVTTQAILRCQREGRLEHILGFDRREHPLSLQLGGDNPHQLAECARIGASEGYDEINLNCGCPSDRVQSGRFGAVLMKTPELVAEAVSAMRAAVTIPVTVKHRIGVDALDQYEDMLRFVDVVHQSQPARFSVHARKAWLKGLSPKENRTVPPLRYEEVYRLKAERPELQVELNGGVTTMTKAESHLAQVDAVMIGRAAYDNPLMFAEADQRFWGRDRTAPGRAEVLEGMLQYLARVEARGARCTPVLRHLMGLYSGERGGRAFRRILSVHGPRSSSGREVLLAAMRAQKQATPPEGATT